MKYLMDLLENVPLREQWRRIITGLHAPKNSGEHTYALYTLMHMVGPSSISLVGSVLIVLAALFIKMDNRERDCIMPTFPIEIIIPNIQKLEKPDWETSEQPKKDDIFKQNDTIKDDPWTDSVSSSDRQTKSFDSSSDDPRPFGSMEGVIGSIEQTKVDL